MKFKIPFTLSGLETLKRKSKIFIKLTGYKKSKLDDYLESTEEDITRRQYLAICYRRFLFNILIFSVVFTSILGVFLITNFFIFGVLGALVLSGFIFFNQINYPRIHVLNKKREIEKNLIPLLQDMIVQLNSGVPIFQILSNIADSDYGEASYEFKKIVKEINSGVGQIQAIEKYAKINTSAYFRRVLWQISNGLRSGSDMTMVISEGIKNLSAEQEIQIQSYGGKLNPLIMFYMLIAVILPSLGITFLIIISSLLGIEETLIKVIFAIVFVLVVFMQIMFLGLIKSKRPSLL
ncbi:MAG: type II secretion system F family protein [Nanoarchaeota archaeon]|nr:type II secretion system F family protein [Nanoarchaeota archaeon]